MSQANCRACGRLWVQLIVSRVAGTSYSAAEVNGIVALMLQHAPRLSSDNVRNIDRLGSRAVRPRQPLRGRPG
jgi:hypothetical protein